MGYDDQRVIQHDFGFPRIIGYRDSETEALYAMLVSVGATKMMAQKLIQNYPEHRTACEAIIGFATDGEGDIRGVIVQIDEEAPRRREQGGAT